MQPIQEVWAIELDEQKLAASCEALMQTRPQIQAFYSSCARSKCTVLNQLPSEILGLIRDQLNQMMMDEALKKWNAYVHCSVTGWHPDHVSSTDDEREEVKALARKYGEQTTDWDSSWFWANSTELREAILKTKHFEMMHRYRKDRDALISRNLKDVGLSRLLSKKEMADHIQILGIHGFPNAVLHFEISDQLIQRESTAHTSPCVPGTNLLVDLVHWDAFLISQPVGGMQDAHCPHHWTKWHQRCALRLYTNVSTLLQPTGIDGEGDEEDRLRLEQASRAFKPYLDMHLGNRVRKYTMAWTCMRAEQSELAIRDDSDNPQPGTN